MTMNALKFASAALTLALASATASSTEPGSAPPAGAQAADAPAPAATANEDATGTGDTQSTTESIMDIPMDGSSVDAFTADLALVKDQAAPGQYQKLNGALQWLLLYDLGAKRDKATLYQRLDGNTPNEIIAKVKR